MHGFALLCNQDIMILHISYIDTKERVTEYIEETVENEKEIERNISDFISFDKSNCIYS